MLSPGYTKTEAAAVDVPVFVGLGERDTAPDPHCEPSAYPNSTDVSLLICDRMAHMHNFATTRHRLWDRFTHWCTAVARSGASTQNSAAVTEPQPTHVRLKCE